MRTVTNADIRKAEQCIYKAAELLSFDSYGRGLCRLRRCQSKLAIRHKDFLTAEKILEEAQSEAQRLNLKIDIGFCMDMLRIVRGSKGYQMQTMERDFGITTVGKKLSKQKCNDSFEDDLNNTGKESVGAIRGKTLIRDCAIISCFYESRLPSTSPNLTVKRQYFCISKR